MRPVLECGLQLSVRKLVQQRLWSRSESTSFSRLSAVRWDKGDTLRKGRVTR